MAESNEQVVLCKEPSENEKQDQYVNIFESAGYKCSYLQTLQFEFINISELQTCLSVPDNYAGIKIVVYKFLTLKWIHRIMGILHDYYIYFLMTIV